MSEKPCDAPACVDAPAGMSPLTKVLLVLMVAVMATAGFVDLDVLKAVVMGALNVLQ